MKEFLQGKWLGHPLHAFLVHVPSALWPAALIFDVLTNFGVGGNMLVRVSFYCILLGLLMALLAIPTGLADWWDIKRRNPAWTLGLYHLGLNVLVTVLWAANLGLRLGTLDQATRVGMAPLVLSMLATVLLLVSGYLGGRMVFHYGVSVAPHARDKWREIARQGRANLPAE